MKPVTRLKKDLKEAESLLSYIDKLIEKGWTTYLGDSIQKLKRELTKEVDRMKKEIEKLNIEKPPKPPKRSINQTPDWWNDLYTDGAGNCFSDADP